MLTSIDKLERDPERNYLQPLLLCKYIYITNCLPCCRQMMNFCILTMGLKGRRILSYLKKLERDLVGNQVRKATPAKRASDATN